MIDSYTIECDMGLHESKKTNADRIRSMTDEELADLMDNSVDYFDCDNCEFRNDDSCGTSKACQTHILRWLQKEIK
jgi:hypothetical protein